MKQQRNNVQATAYLIGCAILATAGMGAAQTFHPDIPRACDDKEVQRAGLTLGGLVIPGPIDLRVLARSALVAMAWAVGLLGSHPSDYLAGFLQARQGTGGVEQIGRLRGEGWGYPGFPRWLKPTSKRGRAFSEPCLFVCAELSNSCPRGAAALLRCSSKPLIGAPSLI